MSRVAVPDIFRVTLVFCVATTFWMAVKLTEPAFSKTEEAAT